MRYFIDKYFPLIIIVLAILPFVFLQFPSNQFFLTHDGPFHIERTFNYVNSLREGNFPPNWTRLYDSDFGSPVFLYLFPFPYWIGSILYLAGINLVSVLKLDFLFWQIVATSGMYIFLRQGLSFSRGAAVLGAIFYLYSPINIAQVFVRGSLRELCATALFPIVLHFLSRLQNHTTRKYLALASVIIGIYLLSDGLTVLNFSPILLSFLIYLLNISNNKANFTKKIFIVFFLGLLVASFIYLPFIFETRFLKGGVNVFVEHLVYWWQYLDYHWGFGFSVPGPKDSLSFQIGIANLLAFAAYLYLLLRKKISFPLLHKLFLACLAFYFILMTYSPVSLYLGRAVSLLFLVQFPWRLLTPAVFIFSFFGATVWNKLHFSPKITFLAVILIMAISSRYLRTNQAVVYDQRYLTNNAGDATAYHEFIPVWRNKTSEFSGFPNKVEIIHGQANISGLIEKNSLLAFSTVSADQATIRVNTLYYPGWKAFVDNNETPITITTNLLKPLFEKRDLSGLMAIDIPAGSHQVNFRFEDTPIRKTGKLLSLLGILAIVVLLR